MTLFAIGVALLAAGIVPWLGTSCWLISSLLAVRALLRIRKYRDVIREYKTHKKL
jgi:hypothetical protein